MKQKYYRNVSIMNYRCIAATIFKPAILKHEIKLRDVMCNVPFTTILSLHSADSDNLN